MLREALGVGLEELQKRTHQPISVAVLDSGIDATHDALRGAVTKAWTFESVEGDVRATNAEVPSNLDVFGHGTAVASIIRKVAPNAELLDYRILGPDNAGAGDILVKALELAVESDARVINMSLAAKGSFAKRLSELCDAAYRAGKVVVAAKRNMPLVDLGFPAELTATISVDRARFETPLRILYRAGQKIEYVGHGEEVVVAAPGGGHTTKTGTSFATPAISGLVALLLGAFPDLRPFEVKSYLRAVAAIA